MAHLNPLASVLYLPNNSVKVHMQSAYMTYRLPTSMEGELLYAIPTSMEGDLLYAIPTSEKTTGSTLCKFTVNFRMRIYGQTHPKTNVVSMLKKMCEGNIRTELLQKKRLKDGSQTV